MNHRGYRAACIDALTSVVIVWVGLGVFDVWRDVTVRDYIVAGVLVFAIIIFAAAMLEDDAGQ
jgi:hypothetical protein